MGLIGIGTKIGYAAGKHLPGAVKAVATAKAPTIPVITAKSAVVFVGHTLLTTGKIVGAGVIALLGAHWAGF